MNQHQNQGKRPSAEPMGTAGKSIMSPPQMNLEASTNEGVDKAINPMLPWNLPWNDKNIKYGKERKDPVATKGSGDKHKFAHNDIKQGNLGDCYFLAALGSVAHSYPNLLASNISGPDGSGNFTVIFFRKNMFGTFEEAKIKIKANFPALGGGDYPAYAKEGDNREMWVMLYEKAYAVLVGSFGRLNEGGHPENALEALTGREGSATHFERGNVFGSDKMSAEEIRDAVLPLLRSGKPVVASTFNEKHFQGLSKSNQGFAAAKKIVGGHAYSILSGSAKHVRLYNPWGEPEIVISWEQLKTFYYRFSNID
jgi:hypothetical protein